MLQMEDLQFFVLLDKSIDEDSFVVERVPKDSGKRGCDLRRSYALRSETMYRFCIGGRTWRITFPGASITS